jgi:hypothetical protein
MQIHYARNTMQIQILEVQTRSHRVSIWFCINEKVSENILQLLGDTSDPKKENKQRK